MEYCYFVAHPQYPYAAVKTKCKSAGRSRWLTADRKMKLDNSWNLAETFLCRAVHGSTKKNIYAPFGHKI